MVGVGFAPAVSVTFAAGAPPLTGAHWPGATVAVTVTVAGVWRAACGAEDVADAPSTLGMEVAESPAGAGAGTGSAPATDTGTASAMDSRAGTRRAFFGVIMGRTVTPPRATQRCAARLAATVRHVNTPALLARTGLYVLLGQALVIAVLAIAVPGGASLLTLAGFVTPLYDGNFFAAHITPIPWTDPTVYVSIQSAVQMLVVALAVAGVVGLIKTNPWQHGVLPDSTPPGRDKAPASGAPPAPAPPATPPSSRPRRGRSGGGPLPPPAT